MADVKALSILSTQIETYRRIPEPPRSLDDVDRYSKNIRQVLDGAHIEISRVLTYIETVEKKIQELRDEQKAIIQNNQDAIQKLFATFVPDTHPTGIDARETALKRLQLAHELEKISKEIMNDRLNDLLKDTDIACAKLKDSADFCYDDVEQLQGCLNSWKAVKRESFEEENRKKMEQQRIREQEERRMEELERKKTEEAEKKKKEEERKKREREEAERKAEEARIQKEENERKKQEEVQRKKKEQAERKKKQEEERKRRLIEEAERKADEERRQKEEEEEEKRRMDELQRKRIEEAERKKKEIEERMKREREEAERKAEEERRKNEEEERLRKENDLRLMQEREQRLKREEDELRRKIEMERIRRQEEVAKRKEEERQRLEAERKERDRLQKEAEERAWRQDINNWKPITYTRENDEVGGKRAYHGDINCVVISPPGGIDKNDLECYFSDEVDSIIEIIENDEKPISSIIDIQSKHGTIHTEVPSRIYIPHFPVLNAGDETLVKLSLDGSEWESITPEQTTTNMSEQEMRAKRMAVVKVNDFSSLKAIVVSRPRCQTVIVDKPGLTVCSSMDKHVKLIVPREAFPSKTELKLVVQAGSEGTFNRLVKETSTLDNLLSFKMITLTCARRPGKPFEIDLQKSSQQGVFHRGKSYQLYTSREKQWKFADVEFKSNNEDLTVTLPAGRKNTRPGESAEFIVKEGQQVEIHCAGNIEDASGSNKEMKLSYLSYMGGLILDMTLRVKDSWKQKDLPAYIGSVRCIVLRDDDSTEPLSSRSIDLTISLPKFSRPRTAIGVARVKLPYYLSSLAIYLSRNLCADDTSNWRAVLRTLLGDTEFHTRYRIAKRKFVEGKEEPVCEAMLLDWMKLKAVQDDKLSPIKVALIDSGKGDIAKSCSEFLKIQKDKLSDDILSDLAENITKDVHEIGQALGINSEKITNCVKQHPGTVKEQYTSILCEWRESEDVINHGEDVLQYLKNACL